MGDFANSTQVHDFEPGIADSGLFWTVPIPDSQISANPGAGRGRYQATDMALPDYHDFFNSISPNPPIPAVASHVSFDVRWAGGGTRTQLTTRRSSSSVTSSTVRSRSTSPRSRTAAPWCIDPVRLVRRPSVEVSDTSATDASSSDGDAITTRLLPACGRSCSLPEPSPVVSFEARGDSSPTTSRRSWRTRTITVLTSVSR